MQKRRSVRPDNHEVVRERWVRTGERRMFVREAGEGRAVVVFDSGCGGGSENWIEILRGAGLDATLVAYDRLGCGKSDAADAPRTSEQIARELRAMLQAGGYAAPYVLVGLSFGGLNVRMFASKYPTEVAGLVLVEAAHEDLNQRMPDALMKHERAAMEKFQGALRDEAALLDESARQVRDARREHGDLPLVVITATDKWGDLPEGIDRTEVDRAWRELQIDLTTLSSNSRHWYADGSGHNVHVDRPEMIIEAVRWVLERTDFEPAQGGE
jgi:pimeloyl-ACP methyl ester carboxylesterase